MNTIEQSFYNHLNDAKQYSAFVLAVACNEKMVAGDDKLSIREIDPRMLVVANRGMLEQCPLFRQVIPYTIMVNEEQKLLVYRRTKESGEAGLHQSISVGFGGHIDACDVIYKDDSELNLLGTVTNSSIREMTEELSIDITAYAKHRPVVVDDLICINTTQVDRVHLGMIVVMSCGGEHPTISMDASTDPSIELLGFFSVEEIEAMESVEPWSKVVIDRIK